MHKAFWFFFGALLASVAAEYDLHGFPAGLHNYHAGPILGPSIIKEPLIHAPVPAPIYAHAAPVIKTIAPATSYATVTQFHISHPQPVVKAVVAPPPIIKTILPAPIPIAHGLPHYHHYPH